MGFEILSPVHGLTIDGGCDNPGDWHIEADWNIINSNLQEVFIFGRPSEAGTYVPVWAGNHYQISFDVVTWDSMFDSEFRAHIGGTAGPLFSGLGRKSFMIEAVNDSHTGAWDLDNFYLHHDNGLVGGLSLAGFDNFYIDRPPEAIVHNYKLQPATTEFLPARGETWDYPGRFVTRVASRVDRSNCLIKIEET